MIIYTVLQNSDLTEGRGPMRNVAYCLNKNIADFIASKCPGVMGSPNGGEVREIEVIEAKDLKDYEDFTKEQIKKTALKKLTKEEKQVLGLPF